MMAIGRVVLSTREHVIALEPRDAGILGMLLHYPYEVRKPEEYFGDIKKVDTPKEMIDLATHIIDTMAGHFHPVRRSLRGRHARSHQAQGSRREDHASRASEGEDHNQLARCSPGEPGRNQQAPAGSIGATARNGEEQRSAGTTTRIAPQGGVICQPMPRCTLTIS
jgi:hypothetical protein